MKITDQKQPQQINESIDSAADRLFESYKNSNNLNDFLFENGNTDDNIALYNFMSLTESIASDDKKLIFENGMYIPGIASNCTGRLSLSNIASISFTKQAFIENVSKMICEDKLMFTPTEKDIDSISESYDIYKSTQIND